MGSPSYIILNYEKKPTEKLSKGGHSWDEVKDFENIGMFIPEHRVHFDFDTPSDAKIMLNLVENLGCKCGIMQTTRGYHFVFKSPKPMTNSIKTRAAIGLYYDVKSYGKPSYAVIKKDGVLREWLQNPSDEEMDEVPFWLRPVSYSKENFKGMKEGDGRNQSLYAYILILQSKGFIKEQIKTIIGLINTYVFSEPLPDSELSTILRDESFKPEEEIIISDDMKFSEPAAIAKIQELEKIIACYGEDLYGEDGKIDEGYLKFKIQKLLESWGIKKNLANTTTNVLRAMKNALYKERPDMDEFEIHTLNHLIKMMNEKAKFLPRVPYAQIRLPILSDENAHDCPVWMKFIHDLMYECDIPMFQEIMGYLMTTSVRGQSIFYLIGSGGEGKSKVNEVIAALLGNNCIFMGIDYLQTNRFATAKLDGIQVMIDDDTSGNQPGDSNIIKQVATVKRIKREQKGKDAYESPNISKVFATGNVAVTSLHDKSEGLFRRYKIIQCKKRPEDRVDDPFLDQKLLKELPAIFNWCLEGWERLVQNSFIFSESERSKSFKESVFTDSNNIHPFLKNDEYVVVTGNSEDKTLSRDLYVRYSRWCNDYEYRAVSFDSFTKYLRDYSEREGIKYNPNVPKPHRGRGYEGIRLADMGGVRS
jgi:putative DNA primase/helicase